MKIMAIDYGQARTGLAVCDRTEFLASPVGVIHEKDYLQVVTKIAYAAKEYDVKAIVVGYPKNMDGSIGEKAKICEDLATKIQAITGLPVTLWDERQTTMQAANYLNETNTRGKKRKAVIDEVAATIILESYLAYRKNHKNEE
ncbi:MAG: Holliday junction resolvase RuvX [Oscillospiraceae bacterium]